MNPLPIPIEVSAKTANQLENFKAYIPQYETLQRAMYEIEGLLDFAEPAKTEQIIGEAIATGKLKASEGAQIPYWLWQELSKKFKKESHRELNAEDLFPTDLILYRTRSAACAWFFTQVVALSLPSFNLAKEWKKMGIDTFPLSLYEDFIGLPIFIPIKNSRYAGVLLSTQKVLASENETIAFLAGVEDDVNKALTYVFSFNFELLAIGDNKSTSVWVPTFQTYSSKEEMDNLKTSVTREIPELIYRLTQKLNDPTDVKACATAIEAVVFLHRHLPSPDWLSVHKKIALDTNSEEGTVKAVPPDHTPFVVLTKDGSFPLYDPNFTLQIKS